ncbi:MAG: hypothetical protein QXK06_00150 [Candidatus Diapherotrites archaeon]
MDLTPAKALKAIGFFLVFAGLVVALFGVSNCKFSLNGTGLDCFAKKAFIAIGLCLAGTITGYYGEILERESEKEKKKPFVFPWPKQKQIKSHAGRK